MLSFMSDRRVLSVSAALITAAIFLFLLGTYPSWRAAIRDGVSWSRNTDPAPSRDNGAAPAVMPPAPNPAGSTSPAPASASPKSPVPTPSKPQPAVPDPTKKAGLDDAKTDRAAATVAAAESPPTFDIVRVEPTGESVVAARAKAGAPVVLLDEGRPIARAQADANGQVAFVPPALTPGEHSLMLSVGEPDKPGVLSSQSVAVSVQGDAKAAPMVALIQPDQPTRIISEAGATTPPAGAPPVPAPQVAVSAIDVEEMGGVYASGKAAPGSHCRVYLNGSFVAPVTAGPDGKWSLKIQRGMKPGHYAVRVDQVGSADGSVQARAEVPFDYPATLGAPSSLLSRVGSSSRPGSAPGQPASRSEPHTGSQLGSTTALATTVPGAGDAARQAAPGSARQLASAVSPTDTDVTSTGSETAGTPTVVAQLLTTKVVRGDSLWRISRKMLGHGRHYTQIYAANTTQIRDPRLIYPGQIFVMPQTTP